MRYWNVGPVCGFYLEMQWEIGLRWTRKSDQTWLVGTSSSTILIHIQMQVSEKPGISVYLLVSQYTYSYSCAGIQIAAIPRYRIQNSAGILGIVSILDWYRPNTAE